MKLSRAYTEDMRTEKFILIVDDNRDAADALEYLLRASGWRVAVVYDGHSAVEAVAHECPDLLLLDIGMPGMNGFEVASQLRELHANDCPSLVALTAWTDMETTRRTQSAGFAAHLGKPVGVAKINEVLDTLLGC